MPRLLIAGCGYVGSAAARLFAEGGWEVIGWTRSGQSAEPPGESAISLSAVDITDLETVRRNSFPADVVVHCASSGPGRSFLLRSVMNGTSVISDHFVNQVHRDDVASAISLLARSRTVDPPRIFNVVDDTPAPRAEILDWLSTRVGLPLSSSPATATPKRSHSNKRVSNTKLRTLGWVPAYPSYREGFDRSVLPALEGGDLRL